MPRTAWLSCCLDGLVTCQYNAVVSPTVSISQKKKVTHTQRRLLKPCTHSLVDHNHGNKHYRTFEEHRNRKTHRYCKTKGKSFSQYLWVGLNVPLKSFTSFLNNTN
jgi:hypothetical protein